MAASKTVRRLPPDHDEVETVVCMAWIVSPGSCAKAASHDRPQLLLGLAPLLGTDHLTRFSGSIPPGRK